MVELAHDGHRDGGEFLAVGLGADIGGDRQLANVEFARPHLAAEGGDQRIDLDEFKAEGLRLHGPVLQGPVVALRAGDGGELGKGHGTVSLLDCVGAVLGGRGPAVKRGVVGRNVSSSIC